MITYTIKIANCAIQINNIYPDCKAFCSDFITDDKPDYYIYTSQDDIDRERAFYESINGKCDSDGIVEIQVVYRKVSESIVDYGAFMMHGASIAVNGYGYIFTGHSGVGKSTHIKKWLLNVPNTIEINGDKPFIIPEEEPIVCGSPWAGKERFYTNDMVPLKAVILLQRAEENTIEQVSLADIYPQLCQQIILSNNIDRTKKTLQMLGSMKNKVSFYKFHMNNFRDNCLDTAYHALVGECL